MIPYLAVFTLMPFFTHYWKKNIKDNKKGSWILAIIIILIPCAIAGMRDISVGVDGEVYVLPLLDIAKTMSLKQFISTEYTEKGYLFLTYMVSKIYCNPNFMFFIMQLITSGIILYSGYKFSDNINITLYILVFSIYIYTDSLNIMRQCMGLAFFTLSLAYLFEKKYIKTVICFIIGIMLHGSTTILGLIYIIYFFNKKVKNKSLKRISLLLLCSVFIVVNARITNIIFFLTHNLHIFSDKYYLYVIKYAKKDLGFNYINTLISIILAIICVYITLHKKNDKNLTINITMLESVIVGVLLLFSMAYTGQMGEIYRISFSFMSIGIMYILAQADKVIKDDTFNKRTLILLIFIILLINWLRLYVIGGKANLYPYILKK